MPTKFVALGGIWLDDIETTGKPSPTEVPGGSVAFATFGARIFASDPSQEIGLIVKAGHDFPNRLLQTFTDWGVNLHVVLCPDQPSARGRVVYGETASERGYQRLTAPLPSTPQDVTNAGLLHAQCFHLFDTAIAVQVQLDELRQLRAMNKVYGEMFVVWEPQAKSCSPDTFEEHRELVASGRINVFSPNHAELQQFFLPAHSSGIEFNKATIEHQAQSFLPPTNADNTNSNVCILTRCAEHGCYVLSRQVSAWLPPFYGSGMSHCVVDPTGAGNAFLGGFAMGYLETADFVQAAKYGTVAASFAVEVVGLPEIGRCDARARLEEYGSMLEDL